MRAVLKDRTLINTRYKVPDALVKTEPEAPYRNCNCLCTNRAIDIINVYGSALISHNVSVSAWSRKKVSTPPLLLED